jgi:LacI family transcriptional regulator
MTAIGLMREAYEQNIRIPDDLSVVGFDDIRLAEFTTPPLTTVQMSQTELAKIAFQALLNEVECEPPSRQHHEYILNTSLVLRRSTALAPGDEVKGAPAESRTRRSGKAPAAGLRVT